MLNEDCVKISRPYILYFPRNKPSKNATARSDRFIVLIYSASHNGHKIVFKFFPNFFKGFIAV